MPRVSTRTYLYILLFVLVAAILLLAYLYWLLSTPPGVGAYRTSRMTPILTIYGYGEKPNEQLYRPHDVAFDTRGNIYVSDTGRKRIVVFDGRGRYLFQFGTQGLAAGQLYTPMGIDVGADGRVYVADKSLSKVAIFDSRGRFREEVRVMTPLKPKVDNGKLYVVTYGPVHVYDLNTMRELAKWGRRGRAEGEFDFANGITIDRAGRIYISDLNNLRVQALSPGGEVIWVKGTPPADTFARQRSFGLPAGITSDERGLLYLVDAFHSQIRVLDSNGKAIARLGRRGTKDGEFYMPAGIDYAGNGVFAIADKFNDRVQVVRITIGQPAR